jgi:hypothetical protein
MFFVLLLISLAMAAVLVRLREKAHERLLKGSDLTPTTAPVVAPAEAATLVVANDMDGTLLLEQESLPLPQDPGARGRALLLKLLERYGADDSTHPVPTVPRAVEQVFLLPVRGAGGKERAAGDSGQLAVVNLAGAFANGHPSGIEAETLTVLSICGTLHANLPQITEVRFLVDGQPRATLAGHADLTRTYLTGETGMAAETGGAGASSAAGVSPASGSGAKP